MKLGGGCLCGAVRYESDALTGPIAHCHCATCRKAHGAAFATTARASRAGDSEPEVILRLGTLDTDPGARPVAHLWTELKASWYDPGAKLPEIPRGRPR